MSKIGRRAIDTDGVQVEIKGQEIHYKGPKSSDVYTLPLELTAALEDKKLVLIPKESPKKHRDINRIWGLHRALLANEIRGSTNEFQKELEIIGLGYKASLSGNKVTFSLGYSHKIDFELPKGVSLTIDKTGKKLTFSSPDKELVGHVASMVKSLRPPEPYKGTGIKFATEEIERKAGKAKAA